MKAIIFVFLDEKVSGLFLELICDNSQIAQIEGRLVEWYIGLVFWSSKAGLKGFDGFHW